MAEWNRANIDQVQIATANGHTVIGEYEIGSCNFEP